MIANATIDRESSGSVRIVTKNAPIKMIVTTSAKAGLGVRRLPVMGETPAR
jgi:hypothetical protein